MLKWTSKSIKISRFSCFWHVGDIPKVTCGRRNLGIQVTSGVETSTNRRAIPWISGKKLSRVIWMGEKVRFFRKTYQNVRICQFIFEGQQAHQWPRITLELSNIGFKKKALRDKNEIIKNDWAPAQPKCWNEHQNPLKSQYFHVFDMLVTSQRWPLPDEISDYRQLLGLRLAPVDAQYPEY